MTRILFLLGLCVIFACLNKNTLAAETQAFNLRDFGAVGDGVTDDGPAFQSALDALASAGGGTLFIPEGKYVIATPVFKNFTGLASSITIMGVESLTRVAPPNSNGSVLAEGLDLLSELYPRTGETKIAISITGLQSLVIKDVAFVGTPTALTDAAVTLFLSDIEKAQIRHSEFYGLATLVGNGAIVKAVRSDLEIAQCKFLGSTANSGGYVPVVENQEWRGLTVSDTTFLDYGNREFYSKTGLAPPISWINIGNAAAPTNHSPRREVVLRNVFLDEGGWWGLSVLPYRYDLPSAPIDLIYITGLVMNVSNFDQFGHQIYNAQRVFIENSRYGWSHNAAAAISLTNVGTGILDHLTCVADADRIYADSATNELTVINSTYAELLSSAKKTNTINTESDEDDPVQYVRGRFTTVLGREPDAAAHFYWSDLLIHCDGDTQCQDSVKETLNNYLGSFPSPTFAISGRILDNRGVPFSDVTITLSGSQSVTTTPDSDGYYSFSNLPTSGRYSITPAREGYIFSSPSETFITPNGDRTANFTAKPATHVVKGTVSSEGKPLAGAVVTLSGSAIGTATTNSAGEYSFQLNTDGSYVLTPSKTHYTFDPVTRSIGELSADMQLDFTATPKKRSISGRVLNNSGEPVSGVVMTLSGSASGTTTTATDGSYSFAGIDDGANCTVTASKAGYVMSPLVQTFNDLAADTVADFKATLIPVLLTMPDSDRAVALELTTFLPEPFSLTSTLLSAGRNRTRITVFGTDLGLLPGEGIEALTAEAEDAAHVRYPLRVEFISPLPDLPNINQIVLRLTGNLEDAGEEVLVSVTVHGVTSNKVRIKIDAP